MCSCGLPGGAESGAVCDALEPTEGNRTHQVSHLEDRGRHGLFSRCRSFPFCDPEKYDLLVALSPVIVYSHFLCLLSCVCTM